MNKSESKYFNTAKKMDKAVISLLEKNITNRFKENSLNELNFISDEYLHSYLSYIKDNRRVFKTVLMHSDSFGFNEVFQRLYENYINIYLIINHIGDIINNKSKKFFVGVINDVIKKS